MRKHLGTLRRYLLRGVTALRALYRKIPRPFLAYAGVILFASGLIVWFFGQSSKPGFPSIPAGRYVGLIEIPANPKLAKVTLYLERRNDERSLITVVFRDGWNVQSLPLYLHEGVILADKPKVFKPLNLAFKEATLSLTGEPVGNEFRGIVTEGEQLVGTWRLRQLAATEWHTSRTSTTNSEWLHLKATHRLRLHEIQMLETRNKELQERITQLRSFSQNTSSLREVRAELAESTAATVESLREDQERYASRVTDLVRELNQLERITHIGQVVSLARRVSNREEKWYSVNWADAQTAQADEQLVAEEMGINIRSLSKELEQAREVQDLKNKIAQESAAIKKLNNEFRRRKEEGLRRQEEERRRQQGPDLPSVPTPQPDQEERPWWRRLDTVFGLIIGSR